VADCQPLLDEILERTGLPISLEGIYRWIAFLPSRVDLRVPVANRYFGVFQNRGEARHRQKKLKLRGIEARRRDTPLWVRSVQIEMIEHLAQIQHPQQLSKRLPGVFTRLQEHWQSLSARRVPLDELLVTQKLSRELEAYRVPSPVARAAAQLAQVGKQTRPGQYIQFVYTIGEPGVHAWNLPQPPDPASVDVAQYRKLLLRAASTVLGPFGVQEDRLRDWLFSNAGYGAPPGWLPPNPSLIPIFSLPAKRDQPSLAMKSG
jgi:DNA polymerase-2